MTLSKQDYEFYNIEAMYIRPFFFKNKIFLDASKKLCNVTDSIKFKKEFKNLHIMFCNLFEINVNLKFCKNKKDLKSYYHSFKKSIFINEDVYKESLKIKPLKKDRIKKVFDLIYTLFHELNHAVIDQKFEKNEDHDYFFLYTLLNNFEKYTGSNSHSLYKVAHVFGNDYKINFKDYLYKESKNFNKVKNKNLFLLIKDNSLSMAYNKLETFLGEKNDIGLSIDQVFNKFKKENSIKIYIDSKKSVYSFYIIYFVKYSNYFEIHIEREEKIIENL